MAVEKIDETDEGYYVQSGDIREWKWKGSRESKPEVVTTETASAVVPPKRKAAARKPRAKKTAAKK
jgi:hypothetical protein